MPTLLSPPSRPAPLPPLSSQRKQDLCEDVLRAALSGLLPPPLPSALSSGPNEDQAEQPWPSPPPPCPLPLSSAPNGPGGGGSGGGGGHGRGGKLGDHHWDEAFLGLLSAAVWNFAAVRRPLVGAAAAVAGQGLAAGAGSAAGAFSSSSVVAAAEAVLRRLYHPRPSVRRLAGSIAVRLAFDGPSFFTPLGLRGVGGGGVDLEPSGGSVGGGVLSLGDGFVLPEMVVRAYPRLTELASDSGSRGGVGGNVSGSESGSGATDAVALSSEQHGGGGGGSGGRNDALLDQGRHRPASAGAFEHLVAGEWALLVQGLGPASSREEARRSPPHEARKKHGDDVVAPRLAGVIRKAGRRSEFAAAMLKARAWVLADPG